MNDDMNVQLDFATDGATLQIIGTYESGKDAHCTFEFGACLVVQNHTNYTVSLYLSHNFCWLRNDHSWVMIDTTP